MIIGIDGRPANQKNRVGIGNYCNELLRAMVPMGNGISFRIYLDQPPIEGFAISPDQADIRVIPPCRLWTQRALARELKRETPGVFLSTGMQIPIGSSCPKVATVHDLAFFAFGRHFTWSFRLSARLQAKFLLRRACHLFAVSESTKRDLMGILGLDSDTITVVHEGASPQYREPVKQEDLQRVRKTYQLPERFVLYVGTLQPRKNIVRLIQAFSELRQKHPGLPHHLVIAGGKGWLYEKTFEAAERSPARDHIQFLDFVPAEDLPALMVEADLLALVSLWEGFGLPVVEAMACGTAVVTSNCSSLPEVAGDAAILVDPQDTAAIGNALEEVLLDEGLRKTLEAKGRVQSARFTWERTAETELKLLKRIVQEHHRLGLTSSG